MALRSCYKGFKKLFGLKTIRPGTLSVAIDSSSPLSVGSGGIKLNIGNGVKVVTDESTGVKTLALDSIIKIDTGSVAELTVNAGGFTTIEYTVPDGYTVIAQWAKCNGAGSSANSFYTATTLPGSIVIGNKDTASHTWSVDTTYILISNNFVGSLPTSNRIISEVVNEEKSATRKTTKKTTVKEGE